MDFLNSMDNTKKFLVVVGVITLVLALAYLFLGKSEKLTASRSNDNSIMQLHQDPQPAQEPPRPPRNVRPPSRGVLVMFFSPNCGHCHNMMPAWEELAQNFNGYNGVQVIKVNGAENQQLSQMHGVQGFPTIKFCPNGVESPEGLVYDGDRSVNSLAQFLQQCAA
jgi:protein disulfide-isomerase-like protein